MVGPSCSELPTNDQVDQIDFGLGRAAPDGGAFDGMIAHEALIHAHAHDAPFERAIDDPGTRLFLAHMSAACCFVTGEQIGQFAEPADNFFLHAEAPGVGAYPADIL